MSVCHCSQTVAGLPEEMRLLKEVTVRLIRAGERERYDQLIEKEHYLKNANAVGQVLRYVAEYKGQWVALLTFCSAALHLKPRDRLLNWWSFDLQGGGSAPGFNVWFGDVSFPNAGLPLSPVNYNSYYCGMILRGTGTNSPYVEPSYFIPTEWGPERHGKALDGTQLVTVLEGPLVGQGRLD